MIRSHAVWPRPQPRRLAAPVRHLHVGNLNNRSKLEVDVLIDAAVLNVEREVPDIALLRHAPDRSIKVACPNVVDHHTATRFGGVRFAREGTNQTQPLHDDFRIDKR